MKCTFCGHYHMSCTEIYDDIKISIKNLIENGVTTFYSACRTDFDLECIRAVGELKDTYKEVGNYIVIAFNDQDYIDRFCFICKFYKAETIFTINDEIPAQHAIPALNNWLLNNSDCILAYVERNHGDAFTMLDKARNNSKDYFNIINLAEKI